MAHKISLSLFLLSVLKVVVSQYGCNVNEYLTSNVNPCNTCDVKGWCPENYGVPACDCFPGYFRNSRGVCVPPEACDGPYATSYGKDVPPPVVCKDRNEEYKECGSACPPTCESSNRVCPAVCVAGCFCRQGYIKNSQGMCVRPDQCSRGYTKDSYSCGANEEFNSCGTSCPATCDNPRPGSEPCILRCVTGCFCTTGYVRNKNGKCVKESECDAPTVGPRNFYGPRLPYRPPVRPLPPVTKPPVVLPPPKPPTYPSPSPPVFRPVYPPPARPPPTPPTATKGCPNRNQCNRNCKADGFAVGFCVGEGFLKCNCMG